MGIWNLDVMWGFEMIWKRSDVVEWEGIILRGVFRHTVLWGTEDNGNIGYVRNRISPAFFFGCARGE